MRALIMATLLAIAAIAPAFAGAGGGSPAHLYTETSNPGESMDSFVARISEKAVATTEDHRAMVCGVIGQAGDRYSLKINTSSSWQTCDINLEDTADGFTSTGVTFQTRTSDEGSHRGFTDEDYKRPKGYIAFDNVVRYQEGRTKDRPVSTR